MKKKFEPTTLRLVEFEHSKPIAKWMGQKLNQISSVKSITAIAKAVKCSESELAQLESGDFRFNLGRIHDILSGYGVTLQNLLEKSVVECAQDLEKLKVVFTEKRTFHRQEFYSIRLFDGKSKSPRTPFFVGGDPDSYLWAVPFRNLEGAGAFVDFLELAERRYRNEDRGKVAENSHPGQEIIHVIRGRVEIQIEDRRGDSPRELSQDDTIHIKSTRPHALKNNDDKNTALVMIVRLP